MQVLIAGEDSGILDRCREVLVGLGATVVRIRAGDAAVAHVWRKQPTLVVTGLRLDGMDALRLLSVCAAPLAAAQVVLATDLPRAADRELVAAVHQLGVQQTVYGTDSPDLVTDKLEQLLRAAAGDPDTPAADSAPGASNVVVEEATQWDESFASGSYDWSESSGVLAEDWSSLSNALDTSPGADDRDPNDRPDLRGHLIADRYRVIGELGRGATATVYEVADEPDDRRFALKLLDLPNETQILRFQREQRILAELDHPNIVAVTDAGEWAGQHYMVMDMLRGGSLHAWMRGRAGGMDLARACRLFAGAADGLHCAHEAGVVHRDVKPGNLVLEPLGVDAERLLVLDFGIAKTIEGGSSLTDGGVVVGSPAYMCPERVFTSSRATHPSWDVYSLGVVMFEVITGLPLFRGRALSYVMLEIKNRVPPPIGASRSDCPVALEELVASMLGKEAAQRPSGCDRVAEQLRAIEASLREAGTT